MHNLPLPYRNGKLWGYANPETGQIIVTPAFDSVGLFTHDYDTLPVAWVKKDGQYLLYNQAGERVYDGAEATPLFIEKISNDYYSIQRFAYGAKNQQEELNLIYQNNHDYGLRPILFLDKSGHLVGKPFYYSAYIDYGEYGCGKWEDPNEFNVSQETSDYRDNMFGNTLQFVRKDNKIGIFDLKKGKIVVEPIFNDIWQFERTAIGNTWDEEIGYDNRKSFLIDLLNNSFSPIPDSINILTSPSKGLSLVQNKTTKLYGFVDVFAKLVIPYQFQHANSFSSNGWTKVLKDSIWSIIDKTGTEIIKLGKNAGYVKFADSSIWIQPSADLLYRKKDAFGGDKMGNMGFDYPPIKVLFGENYFWVGKRHEKTGLLDLKGDILLPFEFDEIGNNRYSNFLKQDSLLHSRYFYVVKNQKKWLFDSKTCQPIKPKITKKSELIVGKSFEKGNFGIVDFISGDSLCVIKLQDNSEDILNIVTGKRWKIENVSNFAITHYCDNCEPIIYPNGTKNGYRYQQYQLDGRIFNYKEKEKKKIYGYSIGDWSYNYDTLSGFTTFYDSMLIKFKVKIPFDEKGYFIDLSSNRPNKTMPCVIIAKNYQTMLDKNSQETTEHRESAKGGKSYIYSMEGKLLSPPYIWGAEVRNNFIFSYKNKKMGVNSLLTGRKIISFKYQSIGMDSSKFIAIDFEGTEKHFNLNGKLIFSYPKGFQNVSVNKDGLRIVKKGIHYFFMNEKFEVLFPNEHFLKVLPFSEGFAAVKDSLGWKYINRSGQQVIKDYFDCANSFENGIAVIQTADGWTKAIDQGGNIIVQTDREPEPCRNSIQHYGNEHLMVYTNNENFVSTLEGKKVLNNCTCINSWGVTKDSIPFYCDNKLGYIDKKGQIRWIDEPISKTSDSDTTKVLKQYWYGLNNCFFTGLKNTKTDEWVVKPKQNQHFTENYYDNTSLVFANTGQSMFTDDIQLYQVIDQTSGQFIINKNGILNYVFNLGWIFFDSETKKGTFYDLNMKSPRDWNYTYKRIIWNEKNNVFVVMDEKNDFVGLISKNGRFLFEN
jgi:hypothetical protein